MTQKVDPFELPKDLNAAIHVEVEVEVDPSEQTDSPSQAATGTSPPPPVDSDPLDTAGDDHQAMTDQPPSRYPSYNNRGKSGAI